MEAEIKHTVRACLWEWL